MSERLQPHRLPKGQQARRHVSSTLLGGRRIFALLPLKEQSHVLNTPDFPSACLSTKTSVTLLSLWHWKTYQGPPP